MAETVLVTGGSGYVAGWCITLLLERGYNVRATVRSLAKEGAVRAALGAVSGGNDRLSFCVADLTSDEGWDAAMAGCAYVLHVASPLGAESDDADALILPARDGTLRVLRAATRAGVQRVVMTSSLAAATPEDMAVLGDESVWTDPNQAGLPAYRRSKAISERAAWDFMAEHKGSTTLTTVLPGAVFGPIQSRDNLGSVEIFQRLLQGRVPAVPRLGLWIVDVRDVAALHLLAMTSPEAAGQRFVAVGDFMWMTEVAATLRNRLGERASRVPRRQLPDVVFRVAAWFVPSLRSLVPLLGRTTRFSAEKAKRVLGFSPRPAVETVVDCAESLVAFHGRADPSG